MQATVPAANTYRDDVSQGREMREAVARVVCAQAVDRGDMSLARVACIFVCEELEDAGNVER